MKLEMKSESKVGLLFLSAIALIVGFAFVLGAINPWSDSINLDVMYNYAGGIEEGSPVRVMGIRVGKVTQVLFDSDYKTPKGEEVKLRIKIRVSRKAWSSIRADSKYFINLAGVIGEKFLEISPGSSAAAELQPGAIVRGEDPPRIDQLISQSYGLAGKIFDLVETNKGAATNIIGQMDSLLTNFNKTLSLLDKAAKNPEGEKLLKNVVKVTDDLAYLTGELRSKKAEESFTLLHKLMFRLENLDGPAIKKFFQEDGIKAKLF
jgi:phospholipid/cholesterol/gamma-HCH transport system substrate-binding protein